MSTATTANPVRSDRCSIPIDLLSRLTRVAAAIIAVLALACAGPMPVVRADPGDGTDAVQSSDQNPSAAGDLSVDEPEPVITLGLPDYQPGSLSEAQTRTVYTQGELRMRDLNERLAGEGASTEDRAKIMVTQRNSLRSWARTLMSDRTLADDLNTADPNLTFADLAAKNEAKGLSGDDLYSAMIASATSSRAGVNDVLGIDPDHPPPLPPILPSQPFRRGDAGAIVWGP